MIATIANIQALFRLCSKKRIILKRQLFINNKFICVNRQFQEKFYSNFQQYHPPWNILFFGSDEFSAESLKLLCTKFSTSNVIQKIEVVTSTKPGRKNSVYDFAVKENLTIHPWPIENPKDFHLGLIVSFGHLIPKRIIDSFPLGMLNVHASLLPRWRGAAPIVHAILNGDTETGVSIMQVKPHRFDIGGVLVQEKCAILPNETAKQLTSKLAKLGAIKLLECVLNLPGCLETIQEQSPDGVTYAPKVTPEHTQADWSVMKAIEVYRIFLAFQVVSTKWNNLLVKLLRADPPDTNNFVPERDKAVGSMWLHRSSGRLRVLCSDNKWLSFAAVHVQGKKEMSPLDFHNGFLTKYPIHEHVFS